MTDELKPVRCGCGGEAKVSTWTGTMATTINDCNVVYCETCGMQTKRFKTEAEAIEAWNRTMGERTAKATRKPEAYFYRCECGYGLCCEKNDMNYCPHCGGRLEWE